jgi:hypothetical protein
MELTPSFTMILAKDRSGEKLEWLTFGLISLYALLTGLAGIAQCCKKGLQVRTILFIMMSMCLLAIWWIPNNMIMLGILILVFIALHILAVLEGLKSNGKLQYSHHIVRFVFHLFIVFLVLEFIV